MADENAASAATDFYDLSSEPAKRAHELMHRRLGVLLSCYSNEGDWVGGADESQEVAKLVAAIHAIDEAQEVEEHVQGIGYIDIDLPGGGTFTARVDRQVGETLQSLLYQLGSASVGDAAHDMVFGEHQHVPGSLRFRSAPIADPEAKARAEYSRQDAARGDAGRKRAVEVDPEYAAMFRVDDYIGGIDLLQIAGHPEDLDDVRKWLVTSGFHFKPQVSS